MRFTLNGKTRRALEGQSVLEAAREAGVDIPAVCAHDVLEPYGACRLCIVEARERGRKRWRVVTSCLYPVADGLEVCTETEKIQKLRAFLLELMLARSPNAPYVRELAARYGVVKTRFSRLDDDCILCGLCVRACSEIVGANAIGFSRRGIDRKVDSPYGIDHSKCVACGVCTFVCPTGAIQMEFTRAIELRAEGGEHPCRYALMGLVSGAVCSLNYECARCEIDQKYRAEAGTHPLVARSLALRSGRSGERPTRRTLAHKKAHPAKRARRAGERRRG